MIARLHLTLVVTVRLLAGGVPALAQVTVTPESLRVVLVQGQETTTSVTLTNGAMAAVVFCLDVDGPLQRTAGAATLGTGCGPPGELLDTFDSVDLGRSWLPYGVTMTPDGRLLIAEWAGGIPETHELTADLTHVRRFPHPVVGELDPSPTTTGVTYHPATGRLWWTNAEESAGTLYRVLLLEGSVDGVATGRRITLPIPPTGPPPTNSGYPAGASYDPAGGIFYYVDIQNDTVWGIDTTGAVPAGYPVSLEAYPGGVYVGNVLDAYGGADGGTAGVRLELAVGFVFSNEFDRVAVTDPEGRDLGYEETPLGAVLALNNGTAGVLGSARSRVDPNGVLYVTYWTPGADGVAAIRPVPLAPSWLALSSWSGTVSAGGSSDVALTFSAGQRTPGEYRSTLAVEDTLGAVLASVPLTLVVEEDTPAEPAPADGYASLSVTPNPAPGAAAVTVDLRNAGPALVAIYDVLGRESGVLHAGPMSAGRHTFDIAAGLRAGVYVVRVTGAGLGVTARFTVAR